MIDPKLTVEVVRLSATLAELLVHVDWPSEVGAEIAGKVTGPHSVVTTTIVIAYPLRPLPTTTPNHRSARVVIPEPNLWTEKAPNMYRVSVNCAGWSAESEIGLKVA